jgi:hypothetical protein
MNVDLELRKNISKQQSDVGSMMGVKVKFYHRRQILAINLRRRNACLLVDG